MAAGSPLALDPVPDPAAAPDLAAAWWTDASLVFLRCQKQQFENISGRGLRKIKGIVLRLGQDREAREREREREREKQTNKEMDVSTQLSSSFLRSSSVLYVTCGEAMALAIVMSLSYSSLKTVLLSEATARNSAVVVASFVT